MAEAKKPEPNRVSAAFVEMRKSWAVMSNLLAGTDALRAAATTYLPKYEGETDERWKMRVNNAVLMNMTEEAVDGIVGRVFSQEPALASEADEAYQRLMADIDLKGSGLSTFTREVFDEAVAKGIAYILVDFPTLAPEIETAEGTTRPRTAADDQANNVRPYWVFISPERVLEVEEQLIGGRMQVTRFRYTDDVTVTDPETFEEETKARVRVIERDRFRVFEANEKGGDWTVVSEGENTIGRVPVVTLRLGRFKRNTKEVKPPFIELARLNLRHLQSYSDQTNILTVTRFPMLVIATEDEATGNVVMGPNTVINHGANGKVYFVEAGGAAMAQGWTDLDLLMDYMGRLSLNPLLAQKSGNVLATVKAMDGAQANSEVMGWAMLLKDAIEQALVYTALWLNQAEENAPKAVVNTDYMLSIDATEFSHLLQMRVAGELSRQTLWEEAKNRGILKSSFDAEVEMGRLAEDGPPLSLQAQMAALEAAPEDELDDSVDS